MEEEGGMSFDFEGGLDVGSVIPMASAPLVQSESKAASVGTIHVAVPAGGAESQNVNFGGRRSFRQTVCRHWLRGLCMKGEACGFLHQYDKSRMPVCRFFRLYGECREQDCVYKHTNEDIKECNMYKLGFCPNGLDCRYRHAKLPGPPPPVEEVLQKIQQLASNNYGGSSNRFFHNRNGNYPQQPEKFNLPPGQNTTTTTTSQGVPARPMVEATNLQQQQLQVQNTQIPGQIISSGQQNQGTTTSTPLPQGISRYFIVKSCNRENLELSVQQGVWATQRSNEAKLNEAFDSVENVILIFSVNRTRNFQGCAKMTSRIGGSVGGGNWKYAHGTPHYGRNFSLKWLKLCELSFQQTRNLRNPYNENLPVKISRDCQELEPSIGEQLASFLYLEPDSELMTIANTAEAKREEEKAKGFNPEKENPDIVPFMENEEEEEEEEEEDESEEEDENYGQPFGRGGGRGRGGMMWAPLPLGHGMRSHHPGMRGGFPYGGMTPDGFPIPDLFNMGPPHPRPFGLFGPRFPGDMAPGMMFPGRPPQVGGGMGMMMGPGRGPNFMGMGNRGVRPAFQPPQQYSQQSSLNRAVRPREQKIPPDQVMKESLPPPSSEVVNTNESEQRIHNRHGARGRHQDGSESEDEEDEAPRRSRPV
ncbi:30-kDa cleavage and polyadenylation specificity factor 30 [Impatiens glandulifera]|uniref:30-kDa cleavage and polyadenylation specificity factor 30 n=1 Tax=Impatiens glandulifera TaxID=253017 RepID=UPI001FB18DE1|nr:30-kDa cleavage and polyadenylation specificity factor 30 [Impatiens glandulifera]